MGEAFAASGARRRDWVDDAAAVSGGGRGPLHQRASVFAGDRTLFTSAGKLSLKNAQHRQSDVPVDAACACYTCTHHSRAFLRHLFVSRELTYFRLATLHNLTYYLSLMARMRHDLEAGSFDADALAAEVG